MDPTAPTLTETKDTALDLANELLKKINGDISLDPSVQIDGDTDLLLTGLVDSLGLLDLVTWLEDRLDVTIAPGDIVLEHFQTCDRMVAFAETIRAAE